MYSLYPQHPSAPYYYDDSYLGRDYLHAVAQRQARGRQAAQYRAQLEEARRRRLYQEQLARAAAMRRRNHNNQDRFMTGFDSFDDRYEEPYDSFFRLRPAPSQYSRQGAPLRGDGESEQHLRVSRDSSEDRLAQRLGASGDVKRQQKRKEREASAERRPVPPPSSSARSSPTIPETKVVAEKASPTPPPSSSDVSVRDAAARTIQSFARTLLRRLSAIRAIEATSRRFDELKANFEFPSSLDFAESPSSWSEGADAVPVPALLYTPRNAQLHGHEHALVKLLSDLDAVESHGDSKVRRARKELVMTVERELSALDERNALVWREAVAAERAKAMPVQESFENETCGSSESEVSELMSLSLDSELAEVDTYVTAPLGIRVVADKKCQADLADMATDNHAADTSS